MYNAVDYPVSMPNMKELDTLMYVKLDICVKKRGRT